MHLNQRTIGFLLFFYMIMVYLLGELIEPNFLDEAYTVLLLAFSVSLKMKKEQFFCVVIFGLYLVYSHRFSANPNKIAQYTDCIQLLKPFAFFYFFYKNPLDFSNRQKKFFRMVCVLIPLVLLISYINYEMKEGLIRHPFTLGITSFCLATFYYYLSNDKKKYNTLLFILLIGLLSFRVKYMLEFLLFIMALFFVKRKIRINAKYTILIILTVLLGSYLAIAKFKFYFVEADEAARFLLYKTMPLVLKDYFPFGSGYASYATSASGVYYSPLYHRYGIDDGYGMTESNYSYISDTFFPVLAEFGVVGIFLFFLFWKKRLKEISNISDDIKNYRIALLIVAMVGIESVAGPVFVMSYNFIPMALLGSICNKSIQKQSCDA